MQRELTPDLAVMAGYFGSKGTHLTLRRNLNQPVNGVRPFAALSESSPILPGTPLGNITQVENTGNSSYNALWVTAKQRLARGLQFNASYTWSKSLDYNSLSLQGVVVQNSYDLQRRPWPFGFRRAPPVRRQRDVRIAFPRQPVRRGLAACRDRSGAERQPGQHRHQQQHGQRRRQYAAARCNRADQDHRRRRALVRYLGVYACRALRQSGPQCGHRARLQ